MSGEQLTLLPAESLASLSVWPGSREAQQMTVTSGQRCLAFLRSCDPASRSLRTLVASSIWRSTMCLLTWKHRVTAQGRSYYRLQASAPHIEEIASGSWPTPRANSATGASIHGTGGMDLQTAVLLHTPTAKANQLAPSMRERDAGSWLLPTPRAEGFDAGAHRGKPDSLHSYVKMLPTPTSQDAANNAGPSQYERNSLPLNAVAGGKLNPAWVSRMMGFPDDWMELD